MFDIYFNGDSLYGVDSYQLMDEASIVNQIQTKLTKLFRINLELKRSTYNHTALIMDYFYGLKNNQWC